MMVTLLVLSGVKSIDFKPEQPMNTPFMLVTLLVLKLDKSNDCNDEQE